MTQEEYFNEDKILSSPEEAEVNDSEPSTSSSSTSEVFIAPDSGNQFKTVMKIGST